MSVYFVNDFMIDFKAKLRILNCLHRSDFGGAQRRVVWVGEVLSQKGIHTTVLFPLSADTRYESWLTSRGIDFLRPRMPLIRGYRHMKDNIKFLFFWPVALFRLVRIMRNGCFDIVHANSATNVLPVLTGVLLSKPVVWHWNDTMTPKWFVRLVAPLTRSRWVQLVVATPVIVDAYKETLEKVDAVVLSELSPPSRGRAVLDHGKARKWRQTHIPQDSHLVGFLGHLVELKGCREFVDVVEALLSKGRNIHGVMVGVAPVGQQKYEDYLRTYIVERGVADRIHLVGFQEEVGDWLAQLDVFLFPSHTEACPIAVIEAMREGVPIVSTIVGDVPRMLGNIPVVLTDVGDVAAMVAGVLKLLDMEDVERRQMSEALKTRMRSLYSLETAAKAHLDVYEKVRISKGSKNAY